MWLVLHRELLDQVQQVDSGCISGKSFCGYATRFRLSSPMRGEWLRIAAVIASGCLRIVINVLSFLDNRSLTSPGEGSCLVERSIWLWRARGWSRWSRSKASFPIR